MLGAQRLAAIAGLSLFSLLPVACGPAGGEAQSDGGARYPDARTSDAGRVRVRDSGAGRDVLTPPDSGVEDLGMTEEPDAHVAGNYTWYEHIEPIIHNRCGLCHTNPPRYTAPRSLMRYQDMIATNVFGQYVHELVAYRLVSPTSVMPPADQPQATQLEIQMIIDWSQQGAPMGAEPADSGIPEDASEPDGGVQLPWGDGGTSPIPAPGLRYIDLFAHAENDFDSPYVAEPGQDGTSYICFGFDVPPNPNPNAMPESAIRFEPFVDNIAHVHHLFVYQIDPNDTVPDGPNNCILGGGGRIIGSWFPGRGDTNLPFGTAVPMTGVTRLNMQVHYDSVVPPGARDMSGLRVLLTEQQGLIPAGEMWAGIDWAPQFGTGDLILQSTVTNTFDDVTIFTATPHMHAKGQRLRLEYRRAADPPNTWTTLRNMDPWNFNNQVLFEINPPLTLNNGDQMRTTCEWTLDEGPVVQGQSSDNEMCYWFLYHYRAPGAIPPLLPFYNFVGFPD